MFERLARFRVVLVTGPQRSGTTIAAKMIVHDTGHHFVPEEEFGPHDVDAWRKLVREGQSVVIQCPTMCRYVHGFGDRDDVAVVLMRRPIRDIRASQERIGWPAEERERELARYGMQSGEPAPIKYLFWWAQQRHHVKHAFEVDFESLSAHPMWVPKERRADFGPRQTAIQEGI